jgi:hypothetical protein
MKKRQSVVDGVSGRDPSLLLGTKNTSRHFMAWLFFVFHPACPEFFGERSASYPQIIK